MSIVGVIALVGTGCGQAVDQSGMPHRPTTMAYIGSSPAITINATSPNWPGSVHGKVDGYALTVYKGGYHHLNTAFISGQIAGAGDGYTATLEAQPFGRGSFKAVGAPIDLTGPSATAYRFSVEPSIATRYRIQLRNERTVVATSAERTVYVSYGGGPIASTYRCPAGHCRLSWTVYNIVATRKAERVESVKHAYWYFAIDRRYPRDFPRFLPLHARATTSRPRQVTGLKWEWQITFTLYFSSGVKYPRRDLITSGCTKDTETLDGYGLPGHHRCGAQRVSTSAPYLG